MVLRRVRASDWLTGLAGLGLVLSLWAPWYGAGGTGLSAWSAFTVVDLWLALSALLALAVPVVTAVRDTPAVPIAVDVLCGTAATLAVLLVAVRLLWVPDGDVVTGRDWGAAAGAAVTVALYFASWWAVRDESAPGLRPAPPAQRMPVPPPGSGPEPVARET